MRKFKKMSVVRLALASATVAAACGSKSSSSSEGGYTPKSLTIQFVPSQAADRLEARAKPLEKMLPKKLGISVKISTSTSYSTVVEVMKSKKVDVGFLPPDGYVLARKQRAANVLLQALRYGIKQPGDVQTKDLVKFYRAEILVKKGSKIKSRKDPKGRSIPVQNPTSSAGYIFPVAELREGGLDVTKKGNAKLVTVTGHDQTVLNVLNGDTDVAFAFEDARNTVKKDNPKTMNQVVPIYLAKAIPNDTISVRSDMNKASRKKLVKVLISIGKLKEGKKLIESTHSHEGYDYTKNSGFNIVRKYDKIAGE